MRPPDPVRRQRTPGARRRARQLDPRAARASSDLRLVVEQRRRQAAESGRPRERIARDGDVVVPEHRRTRRGPCSASSSCVRPRGCESRSPVTTTRSGFRSRTQSAARRTATAPREGGPRWKSERCAIAQPVELLGQPCDRHLEHARPQPARLEPAVGHGQRCHGAGHDQDPENVQGRRPPGSPAPKPPLQS